jgi:putative intracellular protease/amidase
MKTNIVTRISHTIVLSLTISCAIAQQDASVDFAKIVYTCSPCGDGSCDGTYFDKDGTCAVCNMDLIATYKGLPFGTPGTPEPKKVAILLYPGVDMMDFGGPYSVFANAHARIVTVSKTEDIVRVAGGLKINPDLTFKTFQGADILVIPGGVPAESNQDPEIIEWLRSTQQKSDLVLSVCSGAFFLAKAGMLDNQSATTFAGLIPRLRRDAPQTSVVNDRRFVDNGRIIVSAGLASGIDAAFRVVEKLDGPGRAQQIANHLEYNWNPEGKYVRALLADIYMAHPISAFAIFTDSLVSHRGNRDFWESQITISPTISIDKFSNLVETNVKSGNAWVKRHSSGLNSEWHFKGEDNLDWVCKITTAPSSGSVSLVTIRVEKESGTTKQ